MTKPEITAHTGLRGIAALSVCIFHFQLQEFFGHIDLVSKFCRFVDWPNECVDLFFMLSGFILCYAYAGNDKPIRWDAFAAARMARVVPLTAASLLFCIAIDAYSWFANDIWSPNLSFSKIALNLTLLQGVFGNAVENSINPPSWSISVELMLYATVFPVLSQVTVRRFWWLMICALMATGLVLCYDRDVIARDAHWLLRGVFGFSTGFAICRLDLVKYSSQAWSWIGFTACSLMLILLATERHLVSLMIPLLILILIASSSNRILFSKFLSIPPLHWLGERSFSIYLIHHPLIILFHRLILYPSKIGEAFPSSVVVTTYSIVLVATLIGSEISYRCFEMPCRRKLRGLFD